MRTIAHLSWLAGVLEGEGSFQLYKARTYTGASGRLVTTNPMPKIILRMTDRDIVERVSSLLGVGTVRVEAQTATRKTVWHAGIAGSNAAGWMMTLYPWLGARRREQIRKILAIWRTTPTYKFHITREWNRAQLRKATMAERPTSTVWV